MTENNGNRNGNGRWWRPIKWQIRDILLFAGGVLGLANEALREDVPNRELLLVYVAMMLGPAFLAWFSAGGKKKD